MRVHRLTRLASLLVLAGLLAPLGAALAAAPKIEFASPEFNFGKAKMGEVLKHDFIFTNTGTATLEITDVKAGCGCTTAGVWDKKVEPGKTGVIPLQLNSSGFGGRISKSATVTCNDPVRSNVVLQITGVVWKPIEITPATAMFTPFSETPTNETQVLHIVNNLDEPITLSDLRCNNASFKVELKETKPGREFDLHVTALPPFTNATVFGSITLKTSSTNAPLLSVSAYAMVQQTVVVSPQQITLPAGPLKTPVSTSVLIRNNSTNSLAVSDVRLELPGVDVKVAEPQTGRVYSVTMTFPVGFQLPPDQKPALMMKSSHPRFAEIKVPVLQLKPVAAATAPAGAPPGPLRTPTPLLPAIPVSVPPLGGDPAK